MTITHAGTVAFVPQVGDAVDDFIPDEDGDAFDQAGFVDLIGDFGDEEAVFPVGHFFDPGLARFLMEPLPVLYASLMPACPRIWPPVGKSGPLITVIRSLTVASGLSIIMTTPSTTSPRLCGGILVAMPTAMPAEPLMSRLGTLAGRDAGFLQRFVVVGHEVYGIFVDIGQHFFRHARHAHFGVTHGRGRVAVYRAEVAVAVDKHVPDREVLGHADRGVVNGGVAVGVVFTENFTDDARRFFVRFVRCHAGFVHRV
jgi:hypothetical protein